MTVNYDHFKGNGKIMELAAHGHYQLNFQDNILYVEARGPFNKEVLQNYHQDMKDIIQKNKTKNWGVLAVFYGNSILTPEAESALIKVTKYRAKNGMIAHANVFKESIHADLQQTQFSRIYQTAKVHSHFFSDEQSAKNWLSQYLDSQEKKTPTKPQSA